MSLKKAKVPAELHIFPTGGHGYGLRPSEHAVSGWPELCRTWMQKMKILSP
jgi:acetyl esterase/lipase